MSSEETETCCGICQLELDPAEEHLKLGVSETGTEVDSPICRVHTHCWELTLAMRKEMKRVGVGFGSAETDD